MTTDSTKDINPSPKEEQEPILDIPPPLASHSVESRLGMPDHHHWPLSVFFLVLLAFTAYIPLLPTVRFKSFDIVFAVVLLAAVLITSRRRRWMIIGVLLVIPPFVIGSLRGLDESAPRIAYILYFLSLVLFLIMVIIAILLEIIETQRVTIHTISGSMSLFILLAILWAVGYTVIELIWPESFAAPVSAATGNIALSIGEIFSTLFFFSLVSITTAGYGDVTPVTPVARSLTSLELVVGQVFLAILVAWLVGMFIADNLKKND